MSRILLIGGTGSVGRIATARVRELGDTARVLTRRPDPARRDLLDVEVVTGDLGDDKSLTAALDGVDAVVMTHGAPYGSGSYEAVDYGAVPAVLNALDVLGQREVHVVLMSSIGVTKAGRGTAAELLGWKRRGERLLRASSLPHTIVRPGWFDAGTGYEGGVDLRQGDSTDYGPVRREHVAEVLIQSLHTPEALGRTVEVFSAEGPTVVDWSAAFAATDPDQPRALDAVHDPAGPTPETEPDVIRRDLDRANPNAH